MVPRAIWRAGRDGTSIILAGQIRARLAKLVASGLAASAIAVNAVGAEGAPGRIAGTVRSRLVGRGAAVELTLGFAPARVIGEIQRVVDAVADELRALIPGAMVTVTPVALSDGSDRPRPLPSPRS